MKYFVPEDKDCSVFLITSSISGEGKTFCGKNLAYILSISNKKTLLIGADMRKPADYKDFVSQSEAGLSNYLAGMATIDEIIHESKYENLEVIVTGDVPPNPSELILSDRMSKLMDELKKRYDYIILDTPPIGLLSDGYELMKYSDLNLFIVRYNYTARSNLDNINDMFLEGKIKNIAVVFNDLNLRKLQKYYGYGYGYRYSYNYYSES